MKFRSVAIQWALLALTAAGCAVGVYWTFTTGGH